MSPAKHTRARSTAGEGEDGVMLRVRRSTREALAARGQKGETYDDILRLLLAGSDPTRRRR